MTRAPRSTIVALLLPAMAVMGMLVLLPLGYVLWLSLFSVKLSGTKEYVGLHNFVRLAHDALFWRVAITTLKWTVISVLGKVLLGLAFALVLVRKFPFQGFVLALVLLPWAVPLSIGGIAWRWIFETSHGFANALLMNIGLVREPITWLAGPSTALAAVLVASIWTGVPFMTVTFLSGLHAIPKQLYEAAAIDGASGWNSFVRITLPLMRPVLMVGTIISTIWTFRAFDIIYVMTKGGPLHSTEIMTVLSYRYAFDNLKIGQASAVATLVLLILTAITVLYVLTYQAEQIDV